MKNLILIISLFLLTIGLFNFIKYVCDFYELSPYGKGYLTGSVIFIVLGGKLTFWIIRKKLKDFQNNSE